MDLDWGDGDYGRTAAVLAPAAEVAIDAAGVRAGDWVLDVACGTGNAALVAASRGASVVGVDLSPALVDMARARARREQAGDATFLVGDAGSLPVEQGAFDAAVSVFGVIFAPDPDEAVAQMMAAVRPGGALVILSWIGRGPIHEAGRALRAALPDLGGAAPSRWEEPGWVRDLAAAAGARQIDQSERALPVEADDAEAWFAEQEQYHPVWRWARRLVAPERWDALREESVTALRAGSDDPARFHALSPYAITRAVR